MSLWRPLDHMNVLINSGLLRGELQGLTWLQITLGIKSIPASERIHLEIIALSDAPERISRAHLVLARSAIGWPVSSSNLQATLPITTLWNHQLIAGSNKTALNAVHLFNEIDLGIESMGNGAEAVPRGNSVVRPFNTLVVGQLR